MLQTISYSFSTSTKENIMNKAKDELKKQFWNQFIRARISGYDNTYANNSTTSNKGLVKQTEFSGVSVYVNLNQTSVNVTLVIYTSPEFSEKSKLSKDERNAISLEQNIKIFEHLKQNSNEIQKHFSEKIYWKESDYIRKIAIISNDSWQYEKQSEWDDINAYLIKTSYLLKESVEKVLLNYEAG